jgi:hypothetical protein
MSWKAWDALYAPILDGKMNKYRQPPAHFTLCFNVNYPHICESNERKQFNWIPYRNSIPEGPGKLDALKEFEETNRVIAEEYVKHFAEKGWTKTIFEVYHNQKANKDRNRLPWKLDEPTYGHDYKGLRYLFNVAHWAFKTAKENNVNVVTRIDLGHFHCHKFETPEGKSTKCYKAKQYDTHNAQELLQPCTNHWVNGYTHVEGAYHKVKEYEREGVKMIVYGTSGHGNLKQHMGLFAGECIRLAKLRAVGRVVYKLGVTTDPNKAGSSFCLYSGMGMGVNGALPSRRLKQWRDSVNTYEYIHAARKKDEAAANEIIDKMVKKGPSASQKYRDRSKSVGFWVTNNVEDILRAKLKWAEIVTGKKIIEEELEGFSNKYTPCGAADQIVGYD